ncbi:MAG TPA: sigma-70 family RNA polymerase sigma factor [Solirubrobacterales bacterium]|nr:sigma-70 family RNA polymerase sigma factor [Solirubrobacterales bacterium]
MSDAAAAAGFARLLSDERLTRRAVGGDERAFAAIFRRYHQSLYRFCLAIVGNPEDAQDALQNTMVKVLRALPGEERKIDLKPWLYRIAHNESIDLLRRRRETAELDVEQVAPGYALAEDAETRERLRSLIADLRELPDRQRDVLVMRELAGFDFEQIGTALDTTGAVVRQTLYEARQSLHQMEEGREMNCDLVTRALSDGDGRVTRRRDVRAHLRSCADCRSFREEIERREGAFAALSPLPAVAAAGMLQGVLGGSQAAATGGGLAAVLGGGAAQTIGASAAAKGVATIAVVAAVGVTAADKTGVIHLGLPGDGGAKSGPAAPGASGGGSGAGSAAGRDGVPARSQSGDGSSSKGTGEKSAPARGSAPSKAVASPAQGGRSPAPAEAPGSSGHHGNPQAESKGQGPPLEHVKGKEDEDHPGAANGNQEAAAEQAPGVPGSSGGGKDEAAEEEPRSAPTSPPSSSPKPAPTSPPAAKPESPGGQAPTQPAPKTEAAAPSTPPASPGKGSEKSGKAGSAPAEAPRDTASDPA